MLVNKIPGMKKFFDKDNEGGSGEQSIEDVLHFDPFAENEEIPEVEAGAATGDNSDDSDTSDGNENDTPDGEEPAETQDLESDNTPAEKQDSDEVLMALKSINETLTKQKEPQAEEEANKIPNYAFNVPDKLVEVFTSTEDPKEFKQALEAYAQGIAGAIHQQMAAQMESMYKPQFDNLPAMVQQTIAAQKQHTEVRADFYGKFPELDQPALHGVVENVAKQLAVKHKIKQWSPEFRDKVGKAVRDTIAVANAHQNGNANPKPPVMLKKGGRPAVQQEDSEVQDISETLFG